MQYTAQYPSPLGPVLLAADAGGTALTGLWFVGQKHFARHLDPEREARALPLFEDVRRWLDVYFSGRDPGFMPPLCPAGTPFEREVWALLCAIPYGQTTSYGRLAAQLAARRGLARLSAQAVGGAVGRNGISILIPCHRVLGADGSLTGYAGGLERKQYLLTLEGICLPPDIGSRI